MTDLIKNKLSLHSLCGKRAKRGSRKIYADVVELVDTLDLGSSAARCESSSLSIRT
jgi:hypothetical protein